MPQTSEYIAFNALHDSAGCFQFVRVAWTMKLSLWLITKLRFHLFPVTYFY